MRKATIEAIADRVGLSYVATPDMSHLVTGDGRTVFEGSPDECFGFLFGMLFAWCSPYGKPPTDIPVDIGFQLP